MKKLAALTLLLTVLIIPQQLSEFKCFTINGKYVCCSIWGNIMDCD